ncbi:MAG TPA: response regulator [Puia sp.]|nr:response regulator [Puia sp.]
MRSDPIWIVDHDLEDHDILEDVWRELDLPNQLVFMASAEDAFRRLRNAEKAPFIIICEVNLPTMDGFTFRNRLLETHSKKFKSVPFIFWTSHASEAQITEAYNLCAHGFFIKEGSFNDVKEVFLTIVNYWLKSRMPSKKEEVRV